MRIHSSFWKGIWSTSENKDVFRSDNFTAYLTQLDDELGEVVIDVGAGARAVTRFLSPEKHFVIELDYAREDEIIEDRRAKINLDVEALYQPTSPFAAMFDPKKHAKGKLKEVSKLLGNEGECPTPEQADTIVMSLFLSNIEDPESALKYAAKFLKPNGQIIIHDRYENRFEPVTHRRICKLLENAKKTLSELGLVAVEEAILLNENFILRFKKPIK